jgi:hypothetical protein
MVISSWCKPSTNSWQDRLAMVSRRFLFFLISPVSCHHNSPSDSFGVRDYPFEVLWIEFRYVPLFFSCEDRPNVFPLNSCRSPPSFASCSVSSVCASQIVIVQQIKSVQELTELLSKIWFSEFSGETVGNFITFSRCEFSYMPCAPAILHLFPSIIPLFFFPEIFLRYGLQPTVLFLRDSSESESRLFFRKWFRIQKLFTLYRFSAGETQVVQNSDRDYFGLHCHLMSISWTELVLIRSAQQNPLKTSSLRAHVLLLFLVFSTVFECHRGCRCRVLS